MLCPNAKPCQIGSNARYGESHSFERRVTPRLVIRGVNAEIVTKDEVVIRHIEDTIVAVEVARNKNYLYLILLIVRKIQRTHHRQGLVLVHVM